MRVRVLLGQRFCPYFNIFVKANSHRVGYISSMITTVIRRKRMMIVTSLP
ncbi:hypothetical protein OSTOST_16442 [Ostertagia ostertagi]